MVFGAAVGLIGTVVVVGIAAKIGKDIVKNTRSVKTQKAIPGQSGKHKVFGKTMGKPKSIFKKI